MPSIAAVSKIDLPYKVEQQKVKEYAKELFLQDFPQTERLIHVFDHTEIKFRNFCKPLHTYATQNSFEENNKEYIRCSLEYSIQAIEECLAISNISKSDITDIIFVSSTGLATPSLDALIINKLKLHPHINRMAIFGLGCAGGVSGMAKANAAAKANPNAIVLLVTVELCSLTFLRNDYSKSNFVASSLFSDGIAACIIEGDNYKTNDQISIIASCSKLYNDSLDVMGWEFLDTGFKVLFSQDIPTIINNNIKEDIIYFLAKQNLELGDIKNFVFHPGGKKVLEAYSNALPVAGDFLKTTRETMNNYGNMSSATVLYVLESFLREGFTNGYGLMVAMGPGFSSEMVLLEMYKS
ncbi:MAG: 3-oxoacyl-[acyl-carrier-protein] synthase III C-terminal domain-containing protein [Bacteroidota bacterium]|nr:3-oxoacyl-[acyl-carrier-protein] synthase III C-terminal domain-containing protein [Bacteroidota bacterium]